ncbi:MAG: hypothetical protein K0Q51_56 [Rickettsiaceae bacterium]|jgi:hypothetical protein|nr:hypothetical protein [Rickettsiaceae bacterium]
MKFSFRRLLSFSLFSFALYSIIWFTGAHIIKKQIANSINNLNSDNTKFTFKDIEISGYPYKWAINIYDFNILIIEKDNITKFDIANTEFDINILLKSLKITFFDRINLAIGNDFSTLTKYTIAPSLPLTIDNQFSKSLYNIAWDKDFSFNNLIKRTHSKADQITMLKNDLSNATINNFNLVCANDSASDSGKLNIIFSFDSSSHNPNSMIRHGKLLADFSVSLGLSESKSSFIKQVTVNNFTSNVNNTSAFNMVGNIDFSDREAMPKGSFSLDFKNYPELVDIVSIKLKRYYDSENFKLHLTEIINRAAGHNISEQETPEIATEKLNNNAKFDITFTDEGIKIGDLDLTELSNTSKEF